MRKCIVCLKETATMVSVHGDKFVYCDLHCMAEGRGCTVGSILQTSWTKIKKPKQPTFSSPDDIHERHKHAISIQFDKNFDVWVKYIEKNFLLKYHDGKAIFKLFGTSIPHDDKGATQAVADKYEEQGWMATAKFNDGLDQTMPHWRITLVRRAHADHPS